MSEKAEETVCAVCANFEPQAWRKNSCKNCFHTRQEHGINGNGAAAPAKTVDKKDKSKTPEKREPAAKDKGTTDSDKGKTPPLGFKSKSIDLGISFGSKKADSASKTDLKTSLKDTTSKTGASGTVKAPEIEKNEPVTDKTSSVGNKTSLSLKTSSAGRGGGAISHIASKFGDSGKSKTGSASTNISLKLGKDKDTGNVTETKPVTGSTAETNVAEAPEKLSKTDTEKHSKKEADTPAAGESKQVGSARATTTTPSSGGSSASGSSFSFVKRLSKSFSEDEASSDAQESSKETKDQQVPADKSGTSQSRDNQSKSQSPEKKGASPKAGITGTTGKAISSISSKFLGGKQSSLRDKDKDSTKGSNNKAKDKDKDQDTFVHSKSPSASSPKTAQKHASKSPEGKEKEKEKDKGGGVILNRSNSCPSPKSSLRHISLNNRDKDRNSSRTPSSPSPKSSLRHVTLGRDRDSQDKNGSPKSSPSPKSNVKPTFPKSSDKDKDSARDSKPPLPTTHSTVQTDFDDKGELEKLRREISRMEERCKKLEEEKQSQQKDVKQKEDYGKAVEDVKAQLKTMENRCSKLESENKTLSQSLKDQTKKKKEADEKKDKSQNLTNSLKATEQTCEVLREENEKLEQEIRDMKQEMDEMYDQFRESEVDEYRDLQKELEVTAKNCRILQFKLRKTERRNDQVEADRQHYEDKIRNLQEQFSDGDARKYIQTLEEELKMAKEVSVRLNDELDILEDRRSRLEEENTKLQELVTKQDKKEFRMEMEIDKLTDRLDEMQQQLIKAKRQVDERDQEFMERTQQRPVLQTEVSTEYEVSQILRDLYDSIERENDLKDQLHFTEEEIKLSRKKLKDLEEENENLNFQLKKMSSTKTTMTVRKVDQSGRTTDVDVDASEREMQLKLELDLSEQENSVLRKKLLDMEQENETYLEEIGTLAKRLSDKEKSEAIPPPPSSPNAYYEDRLKEMVAETDELKWRLIEKERDIERLAAEIVSCQSRSQIKQLKKSKSLDSDYQIHDLKRQLDLVTQEADALRVRVRTLTVENGKLADDNKRLTLQSTRQIPSIQADDAAVENIELKDKVKKLEQEKRSLKDKLRTITDNIHSLTKDVTKGRHIPGDQDSANQYTSQLSRETEEELRLVEEEAGVLRSKMAELENQNSKLTREVEKLKTKAESPTEKRTDAGEQGLVETDTDDGKTVVELRDKISDMKDEISDLLLIVKRKEESNKLLDKEIMALKKVHVDLKDEFRKTEIELLQDLEMAQQKGDVLSNLLELVSERAEATEKELERVINEATPSPSTRSPSAVSDLSNVSTGSDEVFSIPPSPTLDKPPLGRDWENQFKKRVECLERLLAEERHKVAAAEKRLALVSDENLSSAMSDDVKLRMREKEIMQRELVENQRHLVIASDQIKGLRDRLQTAEECYHKMKMDYEALVRELDRREALEEQISMEQGNPSGVSTLQGLHEELRRYKDIAENMQQSGEMELEDQAEVEQLKTDIAKYKLKSEELEYKVSEINEIWVSKSAASEKEKANLEIQLQTLKVDLTQTKEVQCRLQNELKQKETLLKTSDELLREKDGLIKKRDEIIEQQEDIIKNRDGDFQTMLDQISQRDESIRDLRDALSIRDERLREKDDIIQRINVKLEGKIKDTADKLSSKDSEGHDVRGQIYDTSDSIPDAGKDNAALSLHIDDLHKTIAQLKTEIEILSGDIVKLRKELSNKEHAWQLDKSNLITEMKTYKEKCNVLESMKKIPENDLVRKLSDDSTKLIEEKETLLGEVRKLQIELDNTIKVTENEKDELNQKLTDRNKTIEENLLFAERVQNEAARLRTQAELAYRLQQEEKILRAELLAMKVRYETRLEKIQREYNKLHSSAEKIQRERDLDKDIIKGIQRGMGELRAKYTHDVASWQKEKLLMERKIKEIEDSRKMVNDLKRLAEDMKKKVSEQDRVRANVVNTFNMEKTAWEIEKSNMQSKINQLEEKISVATKTQTRGSKETQSKLEVTWEKERSEQKRLLIEAHNLALDLQQQLKTRDQVSANEMKELIENFEEERSKWQEEKKETEKKIQELEGYTKRIAELQRQFQEVKDRDTSEKEAWQREKCDLVRRLTEARQFQIRQNRKIDDILHTLKRLRELATLVQDVETAEDLVRRSPEGMEGIPDHQQLQKTLDQAVLKYMRDSIHQLNAIMTDLDRYLESVKDELPYMKRSLSSSQVDSKDIEDDEDDRRKDDGPKAERTGRKQQHQLKVSQGPRSADSSPTRYEVHQNSAASSTPLVPITESTARGHWVDSPGSPRPPSYASGSRSAQSSRSASPDKYHSRTSFSPVRKITNYPDPPPSFLISPPHQPHSRQTADSQASADMAEVFNRLTRPQQLTKSVSMDSAPLNSFTTGYSAQSSSGQPPVSGTVSNRDDNARRMAGSLAPGTTGSLDRLSPRTARKKFFADDTSSSTSSGGFSQWPDRRQTPQALFSDTASQNQAADIEHPGYSSLPDKRGQMFGQYPAEQFSEGSGFPFGMDPETDGIPALDPHQIEMLYYPAHGTVARNLPPVEIPPRPPMTWDEKVNIVDNTGLDSAEKSKTIGSSPTQFSPFPVNQSKSATLGPTGVKEKRKLFRKSNSLDNTSISASLGKVGMQMLPPAVPSGFSPSDLLAAVKRKFRPNLKKTLTPEESQASATRAPSIPISKSADNMADISGHVTRAPEAFHSTDISPALTPSPSSPESFQSAFIPTTVPSLFRTDSHKAAVDSSGVPKLTQLFPKPPTPPNRRPPRRWRSKSADRAEKPERKRQGPKPILLHADIITPIQVWKFSETSV